MMEDASDDNPRFAPLKIRTIQSIRKTPRANRVQQVGNHLSPWLGAQIALTMDPQAHGTRLHITTANYQHRVDFGFLGPQDFTVDFVVGDIHGAAHGVPTEFI